MDPTKDKQLLKNNVQNLLNFWFKKVQILINRININWLLFISKISLFFNGKQKREMKLLIVELQSMIDLNV